MTDPAVDAARRVWDRCQPSRPFDEVESPDYVMTLAAREALAPLKELEVPQNLRVVAEMLSKLKMDTPTDQQVTDDFVAMLRNMADNTARLIYADAELNPEGTTP